MPPIPRFRFRRLARQKAPTAPAVPNTTAKPAAVGPSAASPSPSNVRRGIVAEPVRVIAPAVKPLARGLAVGGGALAVGSAVDTALTARAREREASRAKIDFANVPVDSDGDGTPDGSVRVPFIIGQDGAFDVFGASPSHTNTGKRTTGDEVRDTTETVGLVIGGLVILGVVAYVATNPKALKALRRG